MTRRLLAALGVVATTAAACGGSSSGGATADTAHDVDVTETSNGHVVAVSIGSHVIVTLHNTYWTLQPVSGPLRLDAAPAVSPSHCAVVGSGCGTVTATYVATATGTVHVRAHRDSCGEALRCTAGNGDWAVTVQVR